MQNSWLKEDTNDVTIKVLTFLFSPFISAIYSIRRINTKSSFVVFFLFSLCYGMSFTTSNGYDLHHTNDGAAYREKFTNITKYHEKIFKEELQDILSFQNPVEKDPGFFVTAYVVSRLTDNYHFLFLVIAFVFSFFMLKSLSMLIHVSKYKHCLTAVILLSLFAYNGIQNINGIRFNTAAWIAVYALLQIFYKGNNKYYFLLLVTPLVHASYIVLLLVVAIYKIIPHGKIYGLWLYLYLLSFVVSSISLMFLEKLMTLDIGVLFLFRNYAGDQYLQRMNEDTSALKTFFSFIMNLYLAIMIYLTYAKAKVSNSPQKERLLSFTIVSLTIFNFLSAIPSMGRYAQLIWPLLVFSWIIYNGTRKYPMFVLCLPVAFLYGFNACVRNFMTFVPQDFYFSNPFLLIYDYLIVGTN